MRSRPTILILILIATAVLWAGVSGISLNSDDYQFIPAFAPIHSFADTLRPFVTRDAISAYFRPVANMTLALDFLLFHWNGGMYHVTDLIFHLIATVLVFYFARNIFEFEDKEALVTALMFGIIASHESNLVVDSARVDSLATIFAMTSLLLARTGEQKKGYLLLSWLAFFLALCSKEISIMIIFFVPLLFWHSGVKRKREAIRVMKFTLPFVILSIIYIFYRAQFTDPVLQSQPLTAQGAHSIIAFIQNGIFAIGYFILPIDFTTAMKVVLPYRIEILIFAFVGLGLLIWLFIRNIGNATLTLLFKPVLFTILTGAVLFLTFGRWRLYMPSVGLCAIVVLLLFRIRSMQLRSLLLALTMLLGVYHVYRGLDAQAEWRSSTAMLERLKVNLSEILDSMPQRPLIVGILDSPSKLGSASVMQVAEESLLQRAEADRISLQNWEDGTIHGVQVNAWTAVQVYAPNTRTAFRGLEVRSLGPCTYRVTVSDSNSGMFLLPFSSVSASTLRMASMYHVGDTIASPAFLDVIRSARNNSIISIEVHVLDTSARLIGFDGNSEKFYTMP